jgi:hypothetical protein
MRTIRRLYFYSITLISLEIVLWGMIGILRSAFSSEIIPPTERLAQALALLLVGLPVFLLHWAWVQIQAGKNDEEQTATLRSIFLYGVLLATLIPVAQNLVAFFNRTLFELAGVNTYRSLTGSSQHWTDNWIAILLNGIAALYFFTVLSRDWKTIPEQCRHADSRRLYRYTWIIYASFWIVYGVQQISRFLLYISTDTVGRFGYSLPLNGCAFLLVGVPIWLYAWGAVQKSLGEEVERESKLRVGVLLLFSLTGAAITLSTSGVTLSIILRVLLGQDMQWYQFINRVKNPVALGIPVAIAWAYYSYWLNRQAHAFSEAVRGFGLKRLYTYMLAFAGLVVSVLGVALLLLFFVDVGIRNVIWDRSLGSRLADILAILLVGLPLWLAAWIPMMTESLVASERGKDARRSSTRKTYLYAVLFGSVIGGMSSAVWMAYLLISAALGSTPHDFSANLLKAVSLLGLSAGVLVFHGLGLRLDSLSSEEHLAEQHNRFPVTLFDAGDTAFRQAMTEAIHRQTPNLLLTIQPADSPALDAGDNAAQAAILPLGLALNPPDTLQAWLNAFRGHKLIVPVAASGWLWSGYPVRLLADETRQAALTLRQLAEGQAIRPSTPLPGWMVAVWILAILGLLALVTLAGLLLGSI